MPEIKISEKDRTDNRETYSVAEVARKLGISRLSSYLAIQKGQIPALRIGRRILIPRAAFDELLSEVRTKPAA